MYAGPGSDFVRNFVALVIQCPDQRVLQGETVIYLLFLCFTARLGQTDVLPN